VVSSLASGIEVTFPAGTGDLSPLTYYIYHSTSMSRGDLLSCDPDTDDCVIEVVSAPTMAVDHELSLYGDVLFTATASTLPLGEESNVSVKVVDAAGNTSVTGQTSKMITRDSFLVVDGAEADWMDIDPSEYTDTYAGPRTALLGVPFRVTAEFEESLDVDDLAVPFGAYFESLTWYTDESGVYMQWNQGDDCHAAATLSGIDIDTLGVETRTLALMVETSYRSDRGFYVPGEMSLCRVVLIDGDYYAYGSYASFSDNWDRLIDMGESYPLTPMDEYISGEDIYTTDVRMGFKTGSDNIYLSSAIDAIRVSLLVTLDGVEYLYPDASTGGIVIPIAYEHTDEEISGEDTHDLVADGLAAKWAQWEADADTDVYPVQTEDADMSTCSAYGVPDHACIQRVYIKHDTTIDTDRILFRMDTVEPPQLDVATYTVAIGPEPDVASYAHPLGSYAAYTAYYGLSTVFTCVNGILYQHDGDEDSDTQDWTGPLDNYLSSEWAVGYDDDRVCGFVEFSVDRDDIVWTKYMESYNLGLFFIGAPISNPGARHTVPTKASPIRYPSEVVNRVALVDWDDLEAQALEAEAAGRPGFPVSHIRMSPPDSSTALEYVQINVDDEYVNVLVKLDVESSDASSYSVEMFIATHRDDEDWDGYLRHDGMLLDYYLRGSTLYRFSGTDNTDWDFTAIPASDGLPSVEYQQQTGYMQYIEYQLPLETLGYDSLLSCHEYIAVDDDPDYDSILTDLPTACEDSQTDA
ncbi:hypothetical protein KIPB_009061, partial [Kipferlia bialata]